VEAFTNDFFSAERFAQREEQMQKYRAAAVKLGRSDLAEAENLLYEEERTEVVDWLAAYDWNVTAITALDLMARNGRTAPADLDDATPQSVFVEGRLR
jgi:O-methyltransferase involved in polyketide biosynthesis